MARPRNPRRSRRWSTAPPRTADYDDNFHPAISTPRRCWSRHFRRGVAMKISGRALVDAYLVGLEAQAAVGIGVNPSHYTAGWHSTSTCGAIGTAAGVSRLIVSMPPPCARMSMAVTWRPHQRPIRHSGKPFHAGMAARNALKRRRSAVPG